MQHKPQALPGVGGGYQNGARGHSLSSHALLAHPYTLTHPSNGSNSVSSRDDVSSSFMLLKISV